MLPALALACALIAVAGAAPAAASTTQESMLQDDNQLVYAAPSHVAEVLAQLASLGVERVRVSVIWALVAPDPDSSTEPDFDATNPADYPAGAWDRYDILVTDAQALGISVDFDVTSPAPDWATQPVPADIGSKFRKTYLPSAVEFGQFVQAVGTRYSGAYVVPTASTPASPPPPTLLGLPLPPVLGGTTTTTTTPVAAAPLPRVNYWEIWNEPNEAGWLTPQWRRGSPTRAAHGHKPSTNWIEASPVVYRGLVDWAWKALAATGHGGDTVLVGDTSAKGSSSHGVLPAMPPVTFLRALYCVGASDRPLTGARAAELACPANGSTSTFAAEHPGLLAATGYSDHPYSFTLAPNVLSTNPTWATLADLPRFERTLNSIFATYHSSRPGGVPLYLTEYGYKSNPPNPYVKVTQAQQAEYINEGEYMAWRDPYVRALSQFELVDAGPQTSEPLNSPLYWGTFQTGLETVGGVAKPSYYAYRMPIWLPKPRTGPQVTVWGQVRPADHSGPQLATIEYERRGTSAFTTLEQVASSGSQGFIFAHVGLAKPGLVRIAWADPANGLVYHSRTVSVS
jgi:hypothetical protein